jgi:hypothetical protein
MQREQHSGTDPAGKAPSCPHNRGWGLENLVKKKKEIIKKFMQ